MAAVLERFDFAFADLKADPRSSTVFLVLPPDRIASYSRWLRLMVAQGLTELARAPGHPALPILQDVHQLHSLYGQRAGTFLSNAGVLQVFGVNDNDSARLVSDLVGQETVVFETMSRALDAEKSGLSFSAHHTGRPLLTPDEVRTLPESRQLLFLAGQRPIVADKLRYFADREFAGRFDKAA